MMAPKLNELALRQLLAASVLIVTCEKLCSRGILPYEDERNLRLIIVQACKAFGLTPLAERGGGEVIPFPGADSGAFTI